MSTASSLHCPICLLPDTADTSSLFACRPTPCSAAPAELDDAKFLVNAYKEGKEPKGTTEDEVWAAKKLYDSAFHPQTGEKNFILGRMSFQVHLPPSFHSSSPAAPSSSVSFLSSPSSPFSPSPPSPPLPPFVGHLNFTRIVTSMLLLTDVVSAVPRVQVPGNMIITGCMMTFYKVPKHATRPTSALNVLCVVDIPGQTHLGGVDSWN